MECTNCPPIEIGLIEDLAENAKVTHSESIEVDKNEDEKVESSPGEIYQGDKTDAQVSHDGRVKSDTFYCVSHDISWSDVSTDSEHEDLEQMQSGDVFCIEKLSDTKISNSNCDLQNKTCARSLNDSATEEKKIGSSKRPLSNRPHRDKSDLYKCIQGNSLSLYFNVFIMSRYCS